MATVNYENPWFYSGKPYLGEDADKYEAFVYLITEVSTGRMYIGRKYMWKLKTVKGKKKRVSVESDWKKYYSSNDQIKLAAKANPKAFHREILHLCESKAKANYLEVAEQFKRDVLYNDDYFNDQISGKYYKVNVRRYFQKPV